MKNQCAVSDNVVSKLLILTVCFKYVEYLGSYSYVMSYDDHGNHHSEQKLSKNWAIIYPVTFHNECIDLLLALLNKFKLFSIKQAQKITCTLRNFIESNVLSLYFLGHYMLGNLILLRRYSQNRFNAHRCKQSYMLFIILHNKCICVMMLF